MAKYFTLAFLLFANPSFQAPNFLLFIVDDLGIGDIPCYGNTSVPMPNLDKLCKESLKLRHHTSAAVVCTPSRTSFLTGRYAIRSGMVGRDGSAPVIFYVSSTVGLPKNETTFASVLKSRGYTTGFVGKWHQGLNEAVWGDMVHGPLGHGFDYFFGLPYTLAYGFELDEPFLTVRKAICTELILPLLLLIPLRFFIGRKLFFLILLLVVCVSWFFLEHLSLSKARWFRGSAFMEKFLNSFLMENNEVVEKPINLERLSTRLTDKSVGFIERSVHSGNPFLLVHSFAKVHTPLITSTDFVGRSTEHGAYGDTLMELDHCLGRMLDKIRELNIEEETFVYFTSDHGGDYLQIGREGGYNGAFRGGKGNGALEGGMRIPGIIKWPGHVKPGQEIHQPTSLMDILPTLAEIVGADVSSLHLDGRSLLPYLHSLPPPERSLYHYCDSEIFSMRTYINNQTYKMIFQEPRLNREGGCLDGCLCYGPGIIRYSLPLLINLDSDPEEDDPLDIASPQYRGIYEHMLEEASQFMREVETTKIPAQFDSYTILPRPWLQPILTIDYKD